MLKVGARVSPFFNMGKKGIIIELKEVKDTTWMVGGAMSKSIRATVRFDNGDTIAYPISELMPIDD